MANQKKADAAPAVPAPAEVISDEQKKRQEEQDRKIKPVVVAPPAPGASIQQQEDEARAGNPQSSWLGRPVTSWLTAAAADTKAAVLDDIAQAIIARFNADAALAAGRAVTKEWIDGQILTYQLPITEDDVRKAASAAFGTAGIQVQG